MTRVVAVVVDAADPLGLACFWAAALGREAPFTWDDPTGRTYVELPGEPTLLFQPVPEPKAGKNRLHLDVAGGEQADEVARLVDLGATLLDRATGLPWIVLADPEGNELCVLPPQRPER
jgi:hypothetical protein